MASMGESGLSEKEQEKKEKDEVVEDEDEEDEEDDEVPVPTHLQNRKHSSKGSTSSSSRRSSQEVEKRPQPVKRENSSAGVWAALAGMEDDPDGAWDILKKTQVVRAIDPLPLDTPRKPGHTRFVCISDTHSLHETMSVPPGDILIHAGDFTDVGLPSDVLKFNEFIGRLPHRHKIVIAGNHDLTFDKDSYPRLWQRFSHPREFSVESTIASLSNAKYLFDEEINIRGFRIFGSPWQPEFCDWAFNLPRGDALKQKWENIPKGIDVLVTHGPPIGHGDQTRGNKMRVGCVDLLKAVQTIKPAYHVFGHVHEGYGITEDGHGIQYVNASTCTANYKPTNPSIVFDLPNKEGFDDEDDAE
mmetsp:Transcript_41813/g.65318  ORF Transcript_41813/g.65318 Transcript_41813/m.65318 type:complete len:358 (+) Transcript_41813:131-1204(+)